MGLVERLNTGVDRLASKFSALEEGGGQFGDLVQDRPGGGSFGGMVGGGGGSRFGNLVSGGGGSAFGSLISGGSRPSWLSGVGGGARSLIDLGWLEGPGGLNSIRAQAAAAKGANGPGTQTVGSTVTQGAGGWTGPATAADNAAITPDKVEQVIAQTRGNSPLKGKGAWLLAEANKRNISLPAFMGILLAESELGTTAGPGWNVAGVGGPGNFHGYASLDEALIGAMDNLASGMYQPLTLEAKIGYWFAGPEKWKQSGLDAGDGVNGTVRDYITGKVAPMYAAFGVPLQQGQAPTRQQAPGAGVTPSGYSFPVVGYQGKIASHHDSGETGASDIFAPEGTNVVAMRGGKVIDAGWNSLGGNTVTIIGDDGLTYYYAHLRDAPLVRAGQQIAAGGGLGFVGDTGNAKGTGAHLHLGIGKTIISGAGAQGGAGTAWGNDQYSNAVGLLTWVLGGGQATGGGGTAYR